MTMIDGQRWATVPATGFPVRTVLIAWRKGDAERVRAHVARQERFSAAVVPWITARAEQYRAAYAEEPMDRLRDEAALDLICWQRQESKARLVLEWLKRWEETVREFERGEKA